LTYFGLQFSSVDDIDSNCDIMPYLRRFKWSVTLPAKRKTGGIGSHPFSKKQKARSGYSRTNHNFVFQIDIGKICVDATATPGLQHCRKRGKRPNCKYANFLSQSGGQSKGI
jgi:hypothetical protein